MNIHAHGSQSGKISVVSSWRRIKNRGGSVMFIDYVFFELNYFKILIEFMSSYPYT